MGLSCQEVTRKASALIDGELGLCERLQIRLHLAICTGCRRFLDQLATTRRLTETALPPTVLSTADSARIDAILDRLRAQQG